MNIVIDDGGTLYETLRRQAEEWKEERQRTMPDERTALKVLVGAYLRLKDFGWKDASYAPKDGTPLELIEAASTGVHRGVRDHSGNFWIHDGDTWPSHPVLFRRAAESAEPAEGAEAFRG